MNGIMESDRRTALKEIGTSQESRQGKSNYGENPAAAKPKPIIAGYSQAQGIAKFVLRHHRPRSASARGVSGTGKIVRRS